MGLNIGSMLVKAKFDGGNMLAGLQTMNKRFKDSQLHSKQASVQIQRMRGSLLAMGSAALLTTGSLTAMLMGAIMQSPFLAAALEKLKNQMMLFGNAIARHLAPVLEKVVDFIKWLREGFQSLPDPIQSVIVKVAAYGIIALGLISTLGLLGLALTSIKAGLITLGLGSAGTALGAFAAKIATVISGSILLQIGLGLLIGLFGVMKLDEHGVLTWLENLGQKFGSLNAIVRDTAIVLGSVFAGKIGQGIIDISRGDFDFTTMKQGQEQASDAWDRLKTGSSNEYGYDSYTEPTTQIESQNVEFNVDMSGVTGDASDPETLASLQTLFDSWLADTQEIHN